MNKTGFLRVPATICLSPLLLTTILSAQTDPGVQSASRGTGATIITTDPNGFTAFFTDGKTRFQEVENVSKAANIGLGPRFNSVSCVSCHAQPAIGGSGAATNPQFAFAGRRRAERYDSVIHHRHWPHS